MLAELFSSHNNEIWFVYGIWFIGVAIIAAAVILRTGRKP